MKEPDTWKVVQRELTLLDLQKVDILQSSPIFAKKQREVWPYFRPQILRRHGGIQVLGAIGIHVPEFEAWWDCLFSEIYQSGDVGNDCLFALYITNISRFRDPPVFFEGDAGAGALAAWLRAIRSTVGNLPDSYERLTERTRSETLIEDFRWESFYCHPVKVYAFLRWCERNLPDVTRYLQIKEPLARTQPYTEIFEIVQQLTDAAC